MLPLADGDGGRIARQDQCPEEQRPGLAAPKSSDVEEYRLIVADHVGDVRQAVVPAQQRDNQNQAGKRHKATHYVERIATRHNQRVTFLMRADQVGGDAKQSNHKSYY